MRWDGTCRHRHDDSFPANNDSCGLMKSLGYYAVICSLQKPFFMLMDALSKRIEPLDAIIVYSHLRGTPQSSEEA